MIAVARPCLDVGRGLVSRGQPTRALDDELASGQLLGIGFINMVTGEEPTIIVSCSTETGSGKGP